MSAFPDDTFLGLVPVQSLASEPGESGNLILLRPKILSKRWAWVLRMMRKPIYRVKLDARGTAVWEACDGIRTVAQVAEAISAAFPDEPDAILRTSMFIRELARGGFVRFA
jgi:hypothetical protein